MSRNINNLRTEYLKTPHGLDELNPRFYWRTDFAQVAYRIVVKKADGVCVWDSGQVESNNSAHIEYAGQPLEACTRYNWELQVWSEDGECHNASSCWETGVLDTANWRGEWISVERGESVYVPYFRKKFTIDEELKSARFYATARGIYSVSMNDRKITENIFPPGYTDYTKRIHYQTYDVTDDLIVGENEIIAAVADGWYCGYICVFGRQKYGKDVMFLANLRLEYADGSVEWINTGDDWESATGPIIDSDMQMGENYDARLGYGDWRQVLIVPRDDIELVGEYTPPIRRTMDLKSVSCRQFGGKWIFDMGQNMVGWVRLKVSGKRGDKAVLRFAEMLNPDGSIYTDNLRSAKAIDTYILSGDSVEVWEPEFTFHGFRYVELSGVHGEITAETITGIVICTELEETGKFESSIPMVNQLFSNIMWGQRGNFVDIPTDCPQRDERMGWTGDVQAFIRTACYNMETVTLMRKWLTSMRDSQHDDGSLPHVAPAIGETAEWKGSAGWGDAATIVPWTIYVFYGDTRILAENFGMMKNWVGWCHGNSENLIRPEEGFGDWLAPGQETGKSLLSTAFFARSAYLTAKTAEVLGRDDEVDYYRTLFEQIRSAFNREFASPDGTLKCNSQTGYLVAIAFELISGTRKTKAGETLVQNICDNDCKLATGFLGVNLLLPTLSELGYDDIAIRLLLNDNYPSWGYSIKHGATTIWERWDGWTSDKGFQTVKMNSFNHYAYGSCGEWLFGYLAGIRPDPEKPGGRHWLIDPLMETPFELLEGEFITLYGPVKVRVSNRGGSPVCGWTAPPGITVNCLAGTYCSA